MFPVSIIFHTAEQKSKHAMHTSTLYFSDCFVYVLQHHSGSFYVELSLTLLCIKKAKADLFICFPKLERQGS